MKSVHKKRTLFVPPKFLLMPAVGVDISDRSIKYAELVNTKGEKDLGRWGEAPLDSGIIEEGKIVDPERLAKALKAVAQIQNLSFVRAALPEEQVYFFRMQVPDGTKEDIRASLELMLEEHVPILAAETVFDFEVTSHEKGKVEVAVTAASRVIVDSYVEAFEKSGLTLLSLELEAEAVARAVIPKDDSIAHLIIDFGETRTGIVVSHGGQVRFTSTVSMGGKMLTDMLAKHFNVSFEEAEKMKREYGLRRNLPNQDLFSLLLNNIAVLRDEINRHFIYWHTHPDENGKQRPPIEEIVLVGGDSNLAGLSDYLSTSLHVKVSVGDIWTNVNLPKIDVPEISRNDSLGYATAIGLALYEEKQ